jgi:hypothetical protein
VLDKLDELVARRQAGPPFLADVRPGISAVMDRTLRRAMAPAPVDRFSTAGEFADALSGARHLHATHRRVPMPGYVRWALVHHPALSLFLLAFLPHIIGSVVNIAYNQQRIVRWMPDAQQHAFLVVAAVDHVLVYGTAAALAFARVRPVWAVRRSIRAGLPVSPDQAAAARATALRWPAVAGALALLGWLPGGILFPLAIHLWKGPLAPALAGHFVVSFAVSGLIALTYSVRGVQYAVVRGLYRDLWADGRGARAAPAAELVGLDRRLRRLQLLSGSIPLVGACLILVVGPDDRLTIGYRLLIIALIGLRMVGFWLTVLVRERLTATLAPLRAIEPAA